MLFDLKILFILLWKIYLLGTLGRQQSHGNKRHAKESFSSDNQFFVNLDCYIDSDNFDFQH